MDTKPYYQQGLARADALRKPHRIVNPKITELLTEDEEQYIKLADRGNNLYIIGRVMGLADEEVLKLRASIANKIMLAFPPKKINK